MTKKHRTIVEENIGSLIKRFVEYLVGEGGVAEKTLETVLHERGWRLEQKKRGKRVRDRAFQDILDEEVAVVQRPFQQPSHRLGARTEAMREMKRV